MKTILPLIAASVLSLATAARCDPLILDSFSQGGFNLSDSGGARDIDLIAPSIVNIRDVNVTGGAIWTASLDPSISIMRYHVDAPSNPASGSFILLLNYFNGNGPFSIADYNAFYLAIPEVTGTGELRVVAGAGNFTSSIAHPIFQPGEIFYNFSLMTGSQWQEPITNIQFFFIPTSANFSVGVDHIALIPNAVPEPCGAVLLLAGTGLLAAKRRRTKSG